MRVSQSLWVVIAASLAGCHGGGSDSPPPPSGPTYTIGGTVSGLAGMGLVLRNNGTNDLAVNANGPFTFTVGLADAATYAVTVRSQPSGPTQDCVVANGTGTVAAANVTNVTITCTTRSFKVGGTVSGLTGTGLTLRDAAGTTIAINSGSTSFQFPAQVLSGTPYFVAIAAQPIGTPAQVCSLAQPAGVVGGGDVTSIGVVCNSGAARFLYVPDSVSNNVAALRVDAVNGTMSVVQGSPFASAAGPQALAATPGGELLYVQSALSGQVSAFAVNQSSGALTPVAGSPFTVAGGAASVGMYMDPAGRFLYFQQSGTSLLFGFAINASTGALAPIPGSPFSAPAGTGWLGFDPLDRYVYTLSGSATPATAAYRLDNTTGALTSVGTAVATAGQLAGVGAVHPSGNFLYGTFGGGLVHALKVDLATGQLQSVGTQTPGVVRFPHVEPLGRFLYFATDNEVGGYAIAQQTGVLAPISGAPFAAGTQVRDFAIDPAGRYLYAPSQQGTVTGFGIDATTGALTQIAGTPLVLGQNSAPNLARVDAAGAALYVSTQDDDKITKYAINAASGVLGLVHSVSVSNVGNAGFVLVGTQ
jgi:6-phosphogluconolactonase (cycloisomerase 2 family)